MNRDYKLSLNDIRECVRKIERYLNGVSEETFLRDEKLQDAVLRRFEIMGEACRNIPRSLKEKNSHVSWARMENFRDTIMHHYYEISLKTAWKIFNEELPSIKEGLNNIELV